MILLGVAVRRPFEDYFELRGMSRRSDESARRSNFNEVVSVRVLHGHRSPPIQRGLTRFVLAREGLTSPLFFGPRR